MLHRTLLVALVALLAPLLAQTMSETELKTALVRQAITDSAQAWNQGDLDAFMGSYLKSDELTFTAGGRIVRGYDALKQRYLSAYGSNKKTMGTLRFENIEVWDLGPDHVLAVGRWFVLLPPKGKKGIGDPLEGVFSLVLRRTPGGWKILHDHTSRVAEEPAAKAK